MAKIATSYSSYQELLLDIDLYGNIIANSSLDKKEYYNILLSEYIKTNGDPSLKQRRYLLSDLVDSNFKVQYDNDIELLENEELFGFDEDSTSEEQDTQDDLEELDFDIPEDVAKELVGLTDSQRLEKANSLKYFKDKYKYTESIEEKLKTIVFDEDTEYTPLEFEDTYSLNVDLISSLLSKKNQEEELSFDDNDGIDYESYEEPEEYSDEDSEEAEEYQDEDTYEDTEPEEYQDEDTYEDNDSEEYQDEDSYEDSEPEEYQDEDTYSEEDYVDNDENSEYVEPVIEPPKKKPIQSPPPQVSITSDDEDLGFIDKNVVAFNPERRQEKKPVQKPQSKAPPTPYQISNKQQQSKMVKPEPNKTVDKANLPRTVRDFLRQYPNSEASFVLQFYSKQQVQKELMMGNIIKKGTKLHI